ncbi:MAG: RNA polymerase sigma factor [Prosthecobacter sp.]
MTRWTLLQRVRSGTPEEARAALETLCRAYWQPLYSVARRKQFSEHDAQDVVQGFFESMLRRKTFATADESVGKLRQLLLTAFENFCTSQWRHAQRQKRGAGAEHVEFTEMVHAANAEHRYLAYDGSLSIDALYNRAWAGTVIDRSLEALRQDYARRGWQQRYELLVNAMLQKEGEASLVQLAETCGTTPGALRVTLHRMRSHYRSMIERELAATLDSNDPALIREEMAALVAAFA